MSTPPAPSHHGIDVTQHFKKIATPPGNPTPSKTSGVTPVARPIPQTRPTEFIYTPYPRPKGK